MDIGVCRHEDRYSVEVLVESLFRDETASWVSIVSGIEKYVTEAMLTKEEELQALGETCCQSKTTTKACSDAIFRFYSCPWQRMCRHRKHNDQMITSVVKCETKTMTRLLRHDPSVPRGSDGAIHFSDIIEECRRKKVDGASQWLLEDCISTLAKGGGAKKRTHCTLQQFNDIQEVMLLIIMHCKTMDCYRKNFPSTSNTLGTRVKWIPL